MSSSDTSTIHVPYTPIYNPVKCLSPPINGYSMDNISPYSPYVMYRYYPVYPIPGPDNTDATAKPEQPNAVASPELENLLGSYGQDGCWYPVEAVRSPDGQHVCDIFQGRDIFQGVTTYMQASKADTQNRTCEAPVGASSPPVTPRPYKNAQPTEHQVNSSPPHLIPYYNYFHNLDLPLETLGRPKLLHTVKREGQLSVEDLWQEHMGRLFRYLPHPWTLRCAKPFSTFSCSWLIHKDLAKVRFFCKNCNDGWTSMYGLVVFHYRYKPDVAQGKVVYQVSGQKCSSCQPTDIFQLPLWYPEEAQKVITNLYYKVASQVYGLQTPQYIRSRRLGHPSTHHNNQLCQGCVNHMCKPERQE